MMAPRRVVVVAEPRSCGSSRGRTAAGQARRSLRQEGGSRPKAASEAELRRSKYLEPSPYASVFVAGERRTEPRPVKLLDSSRPSLRPPPGGRDAIAWYAEAAVKACAWRPPQVSRLTASGHHPPEARVRAGQARSGDGIITEAAVREIASATTQNP
jgi:hypothetical protein